MTTKQPKKPKSLYPRVANNAARVMVQMRKPFDANNIYAREAKPDHGMSTLYVVYSYGPHWPLFIAETDEGGNTVWYENSGKYSPTTSKYRTQVHPLTECIELTAVQALACATQGIAGVAQVNATIGGNK